WTILKAAAADGIAPYDYEWLLSDGDTEDGAEVNISIDEVGTFKQWVRVTDDKGNYKNKSIDITVKKTYRIVFLVKNSQNSVQKNALVEVDNYDSQTTGTNGQAIFYLTSGKKDVTVTKDGYKTFTHEYDITKNQTFTIALQPGSDDDGTEVGAAAITLISPANDAVLTGTSADFKFKISDDKTNNCSLYLAEGDDDWFELKRSINILDKKDKTFKLTGLTEPSYRWRVECIATDGKTALSPTRTLTFSDGTAPQVTAIPTAKREADIISISDLINQLNQALDNVKNFDTNENIASKALGFEKSIEDALDFIDKTGRDISDLDFRRDLTDEQKIQKSEDLVKAMEDLRFKLPIGLKVSETKKYVKYIREDELRTVIEEYLELKNSKVNKNKFIDNVMDLQKKVTVSATAQIVTLSYMESSDKTITLVIKEMEYSDDVRPPNVTSNLYDVNIKRANYLKLLESIPKELAENVNMLNFTNDYEVLKADPLVQIPADDILIYYFKTEIPLEDIKNTNTILIDTTGGQALDSVTGASVFEFSLEEVKNAVWIIVIIVMVMVIYLAITFKWTDKAKLMWFVATSDKQLHYLRVIINDAIDYLSAGNYDQAAFLYREIKLAYEKLSIPAQNTVYAEVVPVFNHLDVAYLKSLIEKINIYIKTSQFDKARTEYAKMRGTYHKIDPEFKRDIYAKVEPIIKILGNQTNGRQS
ncbi:MAG: carboxypeptidase-like regulatory domain-containing protein, partial [archaeon]